MAFPQEFRTLTQAPDDERFGKVPANAVDVIFRAGWPEHAAGGESSGRDPGNAGGGNLRRRARRARRAVMMTKTRR